MATDYYQMGKDLGSAYSDGQEVKRQRDRQIETDARAKKQYDDQQTELAYQQGQRREVDGAFNSHQALVSKGVGMPEQANPMPDGSTEAPGMRPATQREINTSMGGLAAARRDVAGMATVQAQDRAFRRDDVFAGAGKEWDEMDGDGRAKWAFTGTSGYDGEVYIGTQNAAGYTDVAIGKPGSPAQQNIRLSASETRQMYIASKLMSEGHGEEAQKMMLAGGERLRAIAAEHNKFVVDSAKTANDVKHKANVDRNGAVTAGAVATNAGTHARVATAQIGEIDANRAAATEAKKLQGEFGDLTPEEQNGPEGLALQKRYNMIGAKPGAQLQTANPRSAAGASATVKYETDNLWADAEKKLIGENTKPELIQAQRDGFYARRGFAPSAAVAELLTGRHKATGQKLTEGDATAFQQLFPHTPVDTSKLKWMQPAKPGGLPAKPRGLPAGPLGPRDTAPPAEYAGLEGAPVAPGWSADWQVPAKPSAQYLDNRAPRPAWPTNANKN